MKYSGELINVFSVKCENFKGQIYEFVEILQRNQTIFVNVITLLALIVIAIDFL
jgi:hypothetical protein